MGMFGHEANVYDADVRSSVKSGIFLRLNMHIVNWDGYLKPSVLQ